MENPPLIPLKPKLRTNSITGEENRPNTNNSTETHEDPPPIPSKPKLRSNSIINKENLPNIISITETHEDPPPIPSKPKLRSNSIISKENLPISIVNSNTETNEDLPPIPSKPKLRSNSLITENPLNSITNTETNEDLPPIPSKPKLRSNSIISKENLPLPIINSKTETNEDLPPIPTKPKLRSNSLITGDNQPPLSKIEIKPKTIEEDDKDRLNDNSETNGNSPPKLPDKPNKLRSNSIVTGENPPPLPSKPSRIDIKAKDVEDDDMDSTSSYRTNMRENNEPPPLPPKKKKRNVPPPLPKKPTFYKMRENEESVIFNEEQMKVFLDLEKSIEEQINTKKENMRNKILPETNNVMLDSCSNLKLIALRKKESPNVETSSENKSFPHKAIDKAKDKINKINDLIKVGVVGSDSNLLSDIESGKSTLEIKTWFNKSSSNVVNESKLLKWGKTSFDIDEKTEGLSFIKALVDDYLVEKIESPNLETERHFRILDVEERRRTKRKDKYEKKEDEFSFLMLMGAQKKTYPRLIIPFVIYYLCEKVKELGGKESEGIFRLAIDQEQAKDYLEQIKQYGLIDIRERDPNIPAVVLKRVLGKLEPILTPNFFIYYECITSNSEEDYEKIWEKLPPFNRQIAIYFCSFINEMLDESVVQKTKMDLKNLAIVFAPSVVVDYGLDTVESLKNAPKEMDFFIKYVNWIIKNKLEELLPIDLSSHPLPKTTVLRIHRKSSNIISSSKDANEDKSSSCLDSEDVLSSSSEFAQTEELVEKNDK